MDLFTDTVAILNLLDLRSIMGCQRGTRSALGKKGTSLYISRGNRRSLLYIQQGAHNDLSFPLDYNLFLGKIEEKLARKGRVNTDASI